MYWSHGTSESSLPQAGSWPRKKHSFCSLGLMSSFPQKSKWGSDWLKDLLKVTQ